MLNLKFSREISMVDETKSGQGWYQKIRGVMGWLGGKEAAGFTSKAIEAGKSGHHYDQLHWAVEAEARIPVHLLEVAKESLGFGATVKGGENVQAHGSPSVTPSHTIPKTGAQTTK